MLTPSEMIEAVLNIGEFVTPKFGAMTVENNNTILFVINKINEQLEKDANTTSKYSGYEPNYFMLIAQTMIQNNQFYKFDDKDENLLIKYLSDYNDYYFEQVDNCMPINKVGSSDGNAMFINTFIDNKFGYFN